MVGLHLLNARFKFLTEQYNLPLEEGQETIQNTAI